MNKTEQMALKWLLRQYDVDDITFRYRYTPDFLTRDGKAWEVKRLYRGKHSDKILFTIEQIKSIFEIPETSILVFDDGLDEPVKIIPISEISEKDIRERRTYQGIVLHLEDQNPPIRIRDAPVSLRKEFKTLCARRGKTYREMLQELVDVYKERVRWA